MASANDDSLRVSDLTHFRHMVGSHSTVLRLGVDGELTPAGGWPLQVGMPIHEVLNGSTADAFDEACRTAVSTKRTKIFATDAVGMGGEVTITPVLDDHSSACRYLVCWIRDRRSSDQPNLCDLRPEEVDVRWRRRSVGGRLVVEAAPVWVLAGQDPIELWTYGEQLVALGLAAVVVARVLHEASQRFAEGGGSGFGLCVSLPFAGFLHGIVPTAVGVFRTEGLEPERLTLSVPVAVAVEEHHRSTLMHLQAVGIRLEVQGSGQLAKSLFGLDDRYEPGEVTPAATSDLAGPWASSIREALVAVPT